MLQEQSYGETRLVLHTPSSSCAERHCVVIITITIIDIVTVIVIIIIIIITIIIIFGFTFIIVIIIMLGITVIIVAGAEGICEHQQGRHITDDSLPQIGASRLVWLPQADACAHSVPVTADPQPHQLYSSHQGMT